MDFEKAFPVVVVTFFFGLMAFEAVRPARPLPKVPGWKLKGVVAFFVTGAVASSLPLLYLDFLRAHRVLNLEWLGAVGGAAVAFVLDELVVYWVHRASHGGFLWRAYHQVHHSAERVDVFGSAYFHPLEIAIGGLVGAGLNIMLLGVSAQAAALAGLVAIGLSTFQHTNVRTPHALGYLIQRPESHSVHHRRGFHAKNYSRIPLIDMLFGTFENPRHFEPDAGFYPGASRRLLPMLVGFDGATPPAEASLRRAPASRGLSAPTGGE